jgi:ketosteroid isomerase-like protein
LSRENVEIVRALYERWERRDYDTGDAFDPQVEFARIGGDPAGASGEWRGVDQIWPVLVDWWQVWPHMRFTACPRDR